MELYFVFKNMKYLIYVYIILITHLTESWACISGFVHVFVCERDLRHY